MIELTRSTDETPPEMTDLFSIDGVVYSVPKKPRVNIALKYLDNLRRMGPVIADMMLLEQMVGEKGYKALCEYDDLAPGDLSKVTDAVVALTLGAMEANQGNGDSGSNKSDG